MAYRRSRTKSVALLRPPRPQVKCRGGRETPVAHFDQAKFVVTLTYPSPESYSEQKLLLCILICVLYVLQGAHTTVKIPDRDRPKRMKPFAAGN